MTCFLTEIPVTHLARFWEGVGRQLKCPTGRWGRLTGHVMAVANRRPNQFAVYALGVAPSDTILELGFGPGRGVRALSTRTPCGLVFGIDRSPEMLAQASRNNKRSIDQGRVQLHLGRFDLLPWSEASFDKILAVNVVYFFSDTGEEIREARRVLRPGGVMALYATEKSTMSRWRFAGSDTHALFDEDGLRTLAMQGGFAYDDVSIRNLTLPFGVKGLLAVLQKPPQSAEMRHVATAHVPGANVRTWAA
jgi:SAM-dependent methyltransferase